MANASLGMAIDGGIIYHYTADDSAGFPSILWRKKASDGFDFGTNPWLSATLPVWDAPSTMSFNDQIAIGSAKIGLVSLTSSTGDLVLTIITKSTGVVSSSTTIVNGANKGAADIAADGSDNFYVAWANTANTPNRISKYNSAGVHQWTITSHTAVYSVYYDRTHSRLLIAGTGLFGTSSSIAIISVTDGSSVTATDPSAAGTWLSIRGDGRGAYRVGAVNTLASVDSSLVIDWTSTQTGFDGYKLSASDDQQTTYTAQAGGRNWRACGVLDGDVIGFDKLGSYAVTSGLASLSAIAPVVFSRQNGRYVYFADGISTIKYDPVTNAISTWSATAGSLPVDSGNYPRLIDTWRGRTVVSGILTDPQNWFMSAVNGPTDFDYGAAISATMAVAGNQTNSTTGMPADVITALIPYNDNLLFLGMDHTIARIDGDPMAGGQIQIVSDTVGMAWGRPYCRDPKGQIYFVSSRGPVYRMAPSGGEPTRISTQIDDIVSDFDMTKYIVRMVWDDKEQGFHLFHTPLDRYQETIHYWYDARNESWWPDSFVNEDHNPKSVLLYDADSPDDRKVLIGSWDGYVRAYDLEADDDDGYAIRSRVVIGPIHLKNRIPFIVQDLQTVMGDNSGSTVWSLHVGNSEADAKGSAAAISGVFGAGRNRSQAIHRHGHAAYIKLSNGVLDQTWSLESMLAVLRARSKTRRRIF